MPWITVTEFDGGGWKKSVDAEKRAREYCAQLEGGHILFFAGCPFEFPAAHRQKLLEHRQSGFRFHKNVSYQPLKKKLRGLSGTDEADQQELVAILDSFSQQATRFVEKFLSPYAGNYQLDFASFRPVEEAGRKLTLHKRNDLLHVDAFPNRPTRGGRILRVFVNLNPSAPRVWQTGEHFSSLASRHAERAGLSLTAARGNSLFWKLLYGAASLPQRIFGSARTPTAYDRFMHRFHNYLKENESFQGTSEKVTHEFPPGSTWLVYTDSVPHAVLSGRFALEQTFIIGLEGMVAPRQAPLLILESLCGSKLAA